MGSSTHPLPSQEINFVEAVHNLGYINLYVGQRRHLRKEWIEAQSLGSGGDTQAFAAVLGKSSPFAIGDATMVQMSREAGGPGIVVGTVVQRAHYFGVSKILRSYRPEAIQGVDGGDLTRAQHQLQRHQEAPSRQRPKAAGRYKILEVNPGTEIGAMLAGQADMAVAYQPSVAAAKPKARVVFDFANYVGRSVTPALWSCLSMPSRDRHCAGFGEVIREAGRLVYANPLTPKK